MDSPCFLEFDNQVYAIQNWYLRKNEFDVILLDPLDTQEMGKHSELSKQGIPEEQIFGVLYPKVQSEPRQKVLVDIDFLTKDQLIQLICGELNLSMPSLIYLPTDDLQKLYTALSARSGLLINHN